MLRLTTGVCVCVGGGGVYCCSLTHTHTQKEGPSPLAQPLPATVDIERYANGGTCRRVCISIRKHNKRSSPLCALACVRQQANGFSTRCLLPMLNRAGVRANKTRAWQWSTRDPYQTPSKSNDCRQYAGRSKSRSSEPIYLRGYISNHPQKKVFFFFYMCIYIIYADTLFWRNSTIK